MANILIVSALQVFPPVSGGNYRTAMIATGLAAYGHTVRIYSLLGRKHDMIRGKKYSITNIAERVTEFVERPRRLWLEAMLAYKRKQPPFWATRALKKPATRLTSDAQWAEIIIFDFPFSYCEIGTPGQLKVLNTHNIEAKVFAKPDIWVKDAADKLLRLEDDAIKAVNIVCCSSGEELTYFSEKVPSQRFLLIPNCVDKNRFHPRYAQRENIRMSLSLKDSTRCLLFPASRYEPNQEGFNFLANFASHHTDLLNELDLTFVVTGSVTRKPQILNRLIATGPVPEIEPYFAAADWGLNPIFTGSGTSIKVAEMIAADLPLLTTIIGARGFELSDREEAIFFDRQTFAKTLKNLPISRENLRHLASGAALKNERFLDPELAVKSLHQAIEQHSS